MSGGFQAILKAPGGPGVVLRLWLLTALPIMGALQSVRPAWRSQALSEWFRPAASDQYFRSQITSTLRSGPEWL